MALNARAESAQSDVTLNLGERRAFVRLRWLFANAVGRTHEAHSLGHARVGEGLTLTWLGHQWNALAKRDSRVRPDPTLH